MYFANRHLGACKTGNQQNVHYLQFSVFYGFAESDAFLRMIFFSVRVSVGETEVSRFTQPYSYNGSWFAQGKGAGTNVVGRFSWKCFFEYGLGKKEPQQPQKILESCAIFSQEYCIYSSGTGFSENMLGIAQHKSVLLSLYWLTVLEVGWPVLVTCICILCLLPSYISNTFVWWLPFSSVKGSLLMYCRRTTNSPQHM